MTAAQAAIVARTLEESFEIQTVIHLPTPVDPYPRLEIPGDPSWYVSILPGNGIGAAVTGSTPGASIGTPGDHFSAALLVAEHLISIGAVHPSDHVLSFLGAFADAKAKLAAEQETGQ